jgi:hypothetical protein
MPINDPVKRGKVAPASLAFESRRQGGLYSGEIAGSQTGNVTYQTIINTGLRLTANINVTQAEATTRSIMTAMANAEHRAKHYSSDWHHAFEWDTNSDSLAWTANGTTLGALNILKFTNEVIRSVQGQVVSNAWAFRPSDEISGIWLVSAMVAMRFSPNDKIAETRLVLLKNGTVYRNIDMFNNHFNDKSHVEEVVMQGTALIPLAYGDAVSIGVYLKDQNGTGSGTFAGEPNYYGYVSGARVRCTSATINSASTGNNFDNTV